MGLEIRCATAGDADFIAWTILMSQRGHQPRGWFDIALGRTKADSLAFIRTIATAKTLSLWQVSQFWIVDVDGEAAAACCAMAVGTARITARPAIVEALRGMSVDPDEQLAFWRRGAYLSKCWTSGDDANWLIEHVATRPSHRGQGLAQALLAHVLAEGSAAGFGRASIPFYIGNDAAERCYAKAGFRFAEEKRDPEFEVITGAPGFRRFERPLSPV